MSMCLRIPTYINTGLSENMERSNLTIILVAATPINMGKNYTIMIPNWYGANIPIGKLIIW